MKKYLSPLQKEALKKLSESGDWESSFSLQVRMDTLESLYNRDLIEKRYDRGSHFFPHNEIKWALTNLGARYIEENLKDG